MSLNRENKQIIIDKIINVINETKTIVIAEYAGITVDKLTAIRAKARNNQVFLKVIKNTLVTKAIAGTIFAPLQNKLSGQLIYSMSKDPIAAAKIIDDFAKDNEKVKIIAGMYNDKLLDIDGVKKLANIPSREQLLTTLVSMMQEIPTKFVRCIAAIRDQKLQVSE